ncbi:MAG: chromosome segregation protein SMC [Armatimonadota bacterium]|nr:chromosome segregation protein SMC [Armatimonadota bacterium]MDW8156953.1 chromosome segregation protein SMC [Armatimonadota bacterium]
MYLKRLELSGFKTFADRTELVFGPGITAIVGPNGSGKSNLADAIRWVLGETSWRALRSHRTEDVIFAGTHSRRAHGLAEVHLTMDNEDGVLPVEFAEVTVTRRATRAGDSEFLINRTPCRLRDVQNLFLGTGLGGRAYAMIGQGEVDAILDASPQERRDLLEEAAGLSRYKRRHAEAARRLEHARQNLARGLDRLAELGERARELSSEAERARLHHEYRQRLRQAELHLQVAEYRRVRAQLRRVSAQVEAGRLRHAELQASVEQVERELAAARARARQAEEALQDLQAQVVRSVEEAGRVEQDARVAEQQAMAAGQMRERVAQELDRVSRERQEAAAALERAEQDLACRQDAAQQCALNLQRLEAELAAAEQQLQAAASAVESTRADLVELEHARTHALSARNAARARWEALSGRERALLAQLGRLGSERRELESRRASLKEREATLGEQLQTVAHEVAAAQADLDRLMARRAQLEQEQRDLQLRRERDRARLSVLEEAHAGLVGYEPAARRVLLARRDEPGRFGGVRGALVDFLDADPEHRQAVEAALSDRLFALVVDDWETARRTLEELGPESCCFLAVEAASDGAPLRPTPGPEEGGVAWAWQLVRCAPLVQRLVRAGLDGTLVVQDLEAALRLWSGGWRGRLVTLAGEVLTADGLLAVRRNGSATPLGRVQEIASLRQRVEELDRAEEDLVAQLAALNTEEAALRDRMADRHVKAERVQAELRAVREELARVEARLAGLPRMEQEAQLERSQVLEQLREAEEEEHSCAADLERLGAEVAEARARLDAARARQQDAETAVGAASARLGALRVQHAELVALCRGLQARTEDLRRQRAFLEAEEDRLRAELRAVEAEAGRLRDLAAELARRAAEARRRHEELRAQAEVTARAWEEHGQACTDLEGKLAAAREAARAAQEEAHRAEVRAAQVAAELAAAERRLREAFGEEPEVLEAQTPERVDREAVLAEAESFRARLAELGPVNPRAVEEYQEVQARYEALAAEARDVEQAAALVSELAERLQWVLRHRFSETFEEVNRHFQDCFRRLFGGGRASLERVPVEGGEEGVEVTAQPPGKKVRSLEALSGGERVLVSLALVFALLRAHPSPFCVFDEIEAALDDANTRRVVELLRELARRSQVVIITHNKATMEAADVLYGVTTQEPGVSSVVSVRMSRARVEPAAVG